MEKPYHLVWPHEDNCGHCEHARILEKYIVNVPDADKAEGAKKAQEAWQQTKYFKFAQECQKLGLNWQDEFAKRGWEP